MSRQSAALSPASHRLQRSLVKTVAALVCFLPVRGGGQRTHLGSISSSVQAAAELKKTAAAKQRIRHRAHNARALAGTCFSVGTRRRWTSASEGKAPLWGAEASVV